MAKRTAYVHLGLPHSGGERLDAALAEHAEALTAVGVCAPARSVDEMFRAAVELRREHKAWGLRRKDVEGVWAGVCRRARKGHGPVLVGHPLLAGATEAEIDLLVDGLSGFEVHLVVTVAAPDGRLAVFPDDHDLGAVLGRWERAVAEPGRVHVLVCDPAAPEAAWRALGRLVDVETAGLALPTGRVGEVDVHALRLLAAGTASLAAPDDLAGVVEEWAKLVADRGFDLHGDLAGLAQPPADLPADVRRGPAPAPTALAAPLTPAAVGSTALSEGLADALAEVTRLRARTRLLEADNARLVRKRRRLKQRLRAERE